MTAKQLRETIIYSALAGGFIWHGVARISEGRVAWGVFAVMSGAFCLWLVTGNGGAPE